MTEKIVVPNSEEIGFMDYGKIVQKDNILWFQTLEDIVKTINALKNNQERNIELYQSKFPIDIGE